MQVVEEPLTAGQQIAVGRAMVLWMASGTCTALADDWCGDPPAAYFSAPTRSVPELSVLPLLLAGLAVVGWVAQRRARYNSQGVL